MKSIRASLLMGLLPIFSTAKQEMQQASAEVIITLCLLDIPIDITERSASPAPETSNGFTQSAGKA